MIGSGWFIFISATFATTIQVVLTVSLPVGVAAFVACGLCFFGAATFASSFLARREKGYNARDLAVIAAIATGLIAAGVALMIWSGFRLNIYGLSIDGQYWALVGILVALVTAKREFVQ